MNRLKRWFITPHLFGLTVAVVVSVWQGFQGRLGWAALLLIAAPTAFITVVHTLRPRRARTSRRYPSFVALGVVGWAASFLSWPSLTPVFVGTALFAGLLLYLYWYSEFGVMKSRFLTAGQVLPSFDAWDETGEKVSSRSLTGRPALVLFYRGNWCPVCTAQIDELAAEYDALTQRGIRVVLISPQSDVHTAAVSRRVGLPFEFWEDRDNAAARALGIVDPAGLPLGMGALGYGRDTPIPTALLLDAAGRILYSDQAENYRVRPEPRAYLDAFDQAATRSKEA